MGKKTKTLLLSVATLCVSVGIAVVSTYALFTGEVKVNNHLQAGNLQVGLYRVAYTENTLNDSGLLEEKVLQSEDTDRANDVDLVSDGSAVFAITNAVPQSWYQAKIEVVNNGSVAFDYGVKILWTANDNADDFDEALATQIKVTVTYGDGSEKVFTLNNAGQPENSINVGNLLKGQSDTFTLKAEFVDDAGEVFKNNDVMNQSIEFDLQVFATQTV